MVPPSFRGLLLGFICSFALVAGADVRAAGSAVPDAAAADARAQLPSGPEGELIRYGRDLITHTRKYASKYVKAGMDCSACHIDAGTKPRGGSLLGIYAKFPQWNQRAKRFIALQDRLQECFLYSENGYAPPANSREIIAMTAYIAWLSRGAPVGQGFPNQGFVTVHAAAPPNKAAGAKIFAAKCAACHGADGQGNDSAGFPPLWGPKSFNSGAGMNTKMPAFVKANMPPTAPGSLTDQRPSMCRRTSSRIRDRSSIPTASSRSRPSPQSSSEGSPGRLRIVELALNDVPRQVLDQRKGRHAAHTDRTGPLRDVNEIAFLQHRIRAHIAVQEGIVHVDLQLDRLSVGLRPRDDDMVEIRNRVWARPRPCDRHREPLTFFELHVPGAIDGADYLDREQVRCGDVDHGFIGERNVQGGVAVVQELLQRDLGRRAVRKGDPCVGKVAVGRAETAGGGECVAQAPTRANLIDAR